MKNNRWFSIIMAGAMLCIGAASLFNPIAYFKHIADAIVLPLFLFTVLEVVGHIRNSMFQNLDLEQAKVANFLVLFLSYQHYLQTWNNVYSALDKNFKFKINR